MPSGLRRARRALERQLTYQQAKARVLSGDLRVESNLVRHAAAVKAQIEQYRPLSLDTRVLEVGSGAHGVVFFLGIPTAVGVDPLADEYAYLFPNWQSRVKTICGYGEGLPFDDHSFDVVISDNVVDHARDPGKIVRELARVLAPGGILYFTVNVHHPVYGAASRVHGLLQELRVPIEVTPFADHTVHLTISEARALFDGVGLRTLREEAAISAARADAKRVRARHPGDLLKRVFFKNAQFTLIATRD